MSVRYLDAKGVHFGDIWWSKENNPTRQSGYGSPNELKTLRRELAKGWSSQERVLAEKILDSEAEEAVAALDKQLGFLTAAANSSEAGKTEQLRLKLFKQAHVTSKGEIRRPKWLGATCNRRSTQYLEAMVERASLSDVDDEGREPVWDIPLAYPDSKDAAGNPGRYIDSDTKLQEQVLENERKTAGFKGYGDSDRLWTARKFIVDYGKDQGYIRSIFKDTIGVKLFFLIMICLYEEGKRYALNLFNRLLMPEDGADALPMKKFSHTKLQEFGPRCDIQSRFDRRNESLKKKDKPPMERPTKSDLEVWIGKQMVKEADANAAKIMKRDDIEGLAETCPHESARKAVQAIYKNDRSILDKIYERAEGHNALDHLTFDVFETLEPALLGLEKLSIDDQKAAIAAFAASVATFPVLTVESAVAAPVAGDDDEESEVEEKEEVEA